MTHAPRVPKEEASFADTVRAVEDAVDSDRRDLENRVRMGQPDDSTVSPHEKGRFGNLKQNLTNQWKVRESPAVTQDQVRRRGRSGPACRPSSSRPRERAQWPPGSGRRRRSRVPER
jgi:hypothetical protein